MPMLPSPLQCSGCPASTPGLLDLPISRNFNGTSRTLIEWWVNVVTINGTGGAQVCLVFLVLILLLPSVKAGQGWREWVVSGCKLKSRLGRQACRLTRSLPFHMDFLEMARGLYAVPVPSGSQSPDPGRQNVPECGGAGNNMGAGGGGPQEIWRGQLGSWHQGWG